MERNLTVTIFLFIFQVLELYENNCIFCKENFIFHIDLFNFAGIKVIMIMDKNKEKKDLNRIKLVLVEKKRTNRWLAEQLGKDETTTSKWCTNSLQPNLETLIRIAELLEVEVQELIRTNK